MYVLYMHADHPLWLQLKYNYSGGGGMPFYSHTYNVHKVLSFINLYQELHPKVEK